MENLDKKEPWYRRVDGYDVFEGVLFFGVLLLCLVSGLAIPDMDGIGWMWLTIFSVFGSYISWSSIIWVLDNLGLYGTRKCADGEHRKPVFIVKSPHLEHSAWLNKEEHWGECSRCGELVYNFGYAGNWILKMKSGIQGYNYERIYKLEQLDTKREELGVSLEEMRSYYRDHKKDERIKELEKQLEERE